MKKLTTLFATVALCGSLGAFALAQTPDHGAGHVGQAEIQKMMQDMTPQASDPASVKKFKEAHIKMMKGMHVTFSGNADVDFVRHMIPHHEGAIDMAKLQLQFGKDPELRKMAENIIRDQEKEIGEMRAWLKQHDK